MTDVQRLHWGCGRTRAPGWVNSDRVAHSRVDVCADILEGLPLADESFDYAFSMHALQELAFEDVLGALAELRRILRRGGWLRLCLPDLDKGIQAYLRGDREHFHVEDHDAASLGGKFVVHMLWHGHSRLLFTADFAEELLLRAGFERVHHVEFGETASPFAGIVELDARADESLFVEAVR